MKKAIRRLLAIAGAILVVMATAISSYAFGEHVCSLEFVEKCYDSSTDRLVEQYVCTSCDKNYWECSECDARHSDEELADENREACFATYVKKAFDKKAAAKLLRVEKENNGFFMIMLAAIAVCAVAGVVYKVRWIVLDKIKRRPAERADIMWAIIFAAVAIISTVFTIHFYNVFAEATRALNALA